MFYWLRGQIWLALNEALLTNYKLQMSKAQSNSATMYDLTRAHVPSSGGRNTHIMYLSIDTQ